MGVDEDMIAAYQANRGEASVPTGLQVICETWQATHQREHELQVLRDLRLAIQLLSTRGRDWRYDQLLGDIAVLVEERERA